MVQCERKRFTETGILGLDSSIAGTTVKYKDQSKYHAIGAWDNSNKVHYHEEAIDVPESSVDKWQE